jgi:hypothetical protein
VCEDGWSSFGIGAGIGVHRLVACDSVTRDSYPE